MTRRPKFRTPEQVLKLWTRALRSGEYRQGRDYLRSANSFCCMGVLCDLAAKDGGAQWGGLGLYAGSAAYPPKRLICYIGLSSDDIEKLTEMNDAYDKSFAEIADHIDQHKADWLARIKERA